MNCKKCGNEIKDELNCPFCGERNEKRKIKKRILIPVVSAAIAVFMGICMFSVGNIAEKNRLRKTLEDEAWFTVVGENEFVVIKFEDGAFAASKVTDKETDIPVENYSYKVLSDSKFKIDKRVYTVNFDDEGMEVSPGIANEESESELWYHIEE